MYIKGLQKLTLLDFPDKIACTVFLGGCNFRCPFCHNASLVLPERVKETPDLSVDSLLAFLETRRGILEGVCITGGEPTLTPALPDLLRRIRSLGYAIKLDTNGTRPAALRSLVEEGLLAYVAMDIKNSLARYGETIGIPDYDTAAVEASMDYLMEGQVPFEFRTTLVRGLHTPADMAAVGERLRGEEPFFLQTFRDSGDLIGTGLSAFSKVETQALLDALLPYVPNAQIRGE